MTCNEIKWLISSESGLDITERTRKVDYIKLRAIFYYMCYKYSTEIVIPTNLAKITNNTHASVLHGLQTYSDFYETDKTFRILSNEFEELIKERTPKKNRLRLKKIIGLDDLKKTRKHENLYIKYREVLYDRNRLAKQLQSIKKTG